MSTLLLGYGNIGKVLAPLCSKPIQICGNRNLANLYIQKSSSIILCIKPQDLSSIHIPDNKLIISCLAGKKFSSFKNNPVIRCMPNLGLKDPWAKFYFIKNSLVDSSHLHHFTSLFETLTKIQLNSEDELDLATILYGCSPAFFSQFILSLQKVNISSDISHQMLISSLESTLHSLKSHSASDFIHKVASKGGVTQAGLEHYRNQIDPEIQNMLAVCIKKCNSL